MSKLERILGVGSTELPDCLCGREMTLSSVQISPDINPESELRTYTCPACAHELRLTVWADREQADDALAGL